IVDLDFSKATDLDKVMINDPNGIPVQVVDDGGKKRLRLTDNTGEVSSVFIKTPVPATADYLATFQFEIKNDGGDPADGLCFVAQTAGPDKIGGGGGDNGSRSQSLTMQPIYCGFTAGTGGLGTIQDVLNLKIVSPAP